MLTPFTVCRRQYEIIAISEPDAVWVAVERKARNDGRDDWICVPRSVPHPVMPDSIRHPGIKLPTGTIYSTVIHWICRRPVYVIQMPVPDRNRIYREFRPAMYFSIGSGLDNNRIYWLHRDRANYRYQYRSLRWEITWHRFQKYSPRELKLAI